jgi:hypothetical protein
LLPVFGETKSLDPSEYFQVIPKVLRNLKSEIDGGEGDAVPRVVNGAKRSMVDGGRIGYIGYVDFLGEPYDVGTSVNNDSKVGWIQEILG